MAAWALQVVSGSHSHQQMTCIVQYLPVQRIFSVGWLCIDRLYYMRRFQKWSFSSHKAASSWIPAFAGMTIGRRDGLLQLSHYIFGTVVLSRKYCNMARSECVVYSKRRRRFQKWTCGIRKAASSWIPAFAGMTIGRRDGLLQLSRKDK